MRQLQEEILTSIKEQKIPFLDQIDPPSHQAIVSRLSCHATPTTDNTLVSQLAERWLRVYRKGIDQFSRHQEWWLYARHIGLIYIEVAEANIRYCDASFAILLQYLTVELRRCRDIRIEEDDYYDKMALESGYGTQLYTILGDRVPKDMPCRIPIVDDFTKTSNYGLMYSQLISDCSEEMCGHLGITPTTFSNIT